MPISSPDSTPLNAPTVELAHAGCSLDAGATTTGTMTCFARDPYLKATSCSEVFEPALFYSIPIVFWWALVTIFTVGYGDMAPRTVAGKYLTVVIMLSGIFALALPISVVGAHFTVVYNDYVIHEERSRRAKVIEAEREKEARAHKRATKESRLEAERGGGGSDAEMREGGSNRGRDAMAGRPPRASDSGAAAGAVGGSQRDGGGAGKENGDSEGNGDGGGAPRPGQVAAG